MRDEGDYYLHLKVHLSAYRRVRGQKRFKVQIKPPCYPKYNTSLDPASYDFNYHIGSEALEIDLHKYIINECGEVPLSARLFAPDAKIIEID